MTPTERRIWLADTIARKASSTARTIVATECYGVNINVPVTDGDQTYTLWVKVEEPVNA